MVEINLFFVALTISISVLLAVAISSLVKLIMSYEKGRDFVKWRMFKF